MRAVKRWLKSVLPPSAVLRLAALNHRWCIEPEVRWLPGYVDSARASLDVGANQGVFSRALATLSPRVYAFEPNPEMVAFLKQSAASNVEIRPLALSDQTGESELHVPIIRGVTVTGRASLESRALEGIPQTKTIAVTLARLDDQELPAVGFIKIDVEGHELKVLKGALELIQRDRPVLWIEIEQRHIAEPIAERIEAITLLGYQGEFFINGNPRPLSEFDPKQHQQPFEGDVRPSVYANNFVFKPR